MPRKTTSSPPPKVMTWGRATPVLVVAAIFDALRFMFEWFIFFGPALAGVACTVVAGGTTVAGLLCGAGATVGGFFGSAVIGSLGMIMAMATGFAGWLVILIIFLVFNARIFKENALWFGCSLLLSEIPFVNSLPAFTFTVWKMYRTQIRIEKAALAKWKKESAAAQQQMLNRQNAELMQNRALQQQALDQEWENQLVQQEEQRAAEAMSEESASSSVAPLHTPIQPKPTRQPPRLAIVPNYAEPTKITKTGDKEIPEEVRKAA